MSRIFLVLACLGLNMFSFSQVLPVSPTKPTPNAASIAIYGEFPVSHFTGTPNIDVPIYSLKSEFYDIPISASYHASGFRPDVHPSWIGLNWTLNAGGVITRKVVHIPDERKPISGRTLSETEKGFYYSYSLLNASNWSDPATHAISFGGFIDRQPDIFSFNFLGYSGEFFLDQTGNFKVRSDQNIKVEFNSSDFHAPLLFGTPGDLQRTTFTKFTLIDDKGVRYVFGTQGAIEYSVGMSLSGNITFDNNTLATSWYLVEIKPPYGESVFFSYYRGPFQSSFSYYQSSCYATGGDVSGKGFLNRWGVIGKYNVGVSGSIVSPVYLGSISSRKHNVTINFITSKSNELKYPANIYKELARLQDRSFPTSIPLPFTYLPLTANIPYFSSNPGEVPITYDDYNTSKFIWLKLDRIVVKHLNSLDVKDYSKIRDYTWKTVKFNYHENVNSRLRLENIEFQGKGNLKPYKYQFTYKDWPTSTYLSEITDHWGFANGYQLQYSTSWGFSDISNLTLARTPNLFHASKGIIDEIVYPTGGKSKFYFQSNSYSEAVNQYPYGSATINEVGTAGGLRLQKIENTSGTGPTNTKEYFYVNEYSNASGPGSVSSGVLTRRPFYSFSITYPSGSGTAYFTLSNSTSYFPASYHGAQNHVNYSKVVEKSTDGSYSVFVYSNYNNNYNDIGPVALAQSSSIPILPYSSLHFERGKLINKSIFSSADLELEKESTVYGRIGYSTSSAARSVLLDETIWCPMGMPGSSSSDPSISSVWGFGAYYLFNHKFKPIKITRTSKNTLNQTIVTEEDIVYDSYSNIESRKIKNSKQKINETRYLYPYHFTSETIYAMMVSKNMTSLPIQIEQYLDASLQQTIKIDYSQFGSNVIAPSIEKIKYQGQSVFENKRKFNAYDDYGNIREIEHSNGIKEVYIWGFSGKIPVATILGTSYNSIVGLLDYNIINWPDGMSQLETHLNSIKPSLGLLSRMQYSIPDYALNTVKTVDENGHSTQYRYDVHDRLALVLDKDNRIIKQNCYSYNGDVSDCITTAMWSSTGLNRCKPCALNNNYSTNIQETEEMDFNPFSNTYNTSRWVETGTSSSCIVAPDWQNTVSALRCKKNASNQNTGEQEQEQRDVNPCSSTYNQTRWVVVSTNVQACPTSTNVTILCNNTVSGGTIYMQYHNINTGQIYNFNTASMGYNISLGTIPAGPYNIMIGSSHYNTPLYYSVACGFYFNGVSAVFNNVNVDNTCRTVTISPY